MATLGGLMAPALGCATPTLPFSKQPPIVERIEVRSVGGGELALSAVARDVRGLPLTYAWSTTERFYNMIGDTFGGVAGESAEVRWKPGMAAQMPGYLRVEVRVSNGTWAKVRSMHLVTRGDGTVQPIDLGAREELVGTPLAALYSNQAPNYVSPPAVADRPGNATGDPGLVRVLVPQAVAPTGSFGSAQDAADEEVTTIAGTWRDEKRVQFELAQDGRKLSASHDGTTYEGTIDADDNIRLMAWGVDAGERVGELGYMDRRMVILWEDGTRWERVF